MLKQALLREFVLYFTASSLAFGVDFAMLAALVEIAGWHYLPAATLSFVLGGVTLYFTSVKFVFEFRRVPAARFELPVFVALGLAGLAVNLAVMRFAIDFIHWHWALAKILAAGCSLSLNYLIRRLVLFAPVARTASTRSSVQ
jgi:putative flippase GtrA